EVMTRRLIERHRDKHSEAWQRGGRAAATWRAHPEEMAKKTVCLKASKTWPISNPGGSGADDVGAELIEQERQPMRDITPPTSPASTGRPARLAAFAAE